MSRITNNGMSNTKRIVLVISSLSSGGAERVMVTLANNLAWRGYKVTLITLRSNKCDWYTLDKSVTRIVVGHVDYKSPLSYIVNCFKKTMHIRKLFITLHPEIIISFLTGVNIIVMLASLGLGKKVIISERVDPTMHRTIPITWKLMRKLTYPFVDNLVVQTSSIANYFSPRLKSKVVVIPNPVLPQSSLSQKNTHFQKPCIVAMGRLVNQKGFDLLITSFSQIAIKYPAWKLVIIGEGDKRRELEQLVARFKLKDKVTLMGRIINPQSMLQHADIFVLSSRYEGFPNALLEAMACGLPVISFNCPSGPAEIIHHNYDGILVSPADMPQLTLAMERLIKSKPLRKKLGNNAKYVTTRYSVDIIIEKWEKLIV